MSSSIWHSLNRQGLLRVPPLGLEVVQCAMAYRIRRCICLIQMERLAPLAAKRLLDEIVTSQLQLNMCVR